MLAFSLKKGVIRCLVNLAIHLRENIRVALLAGHFSSWRDPFVFCWNFCWFILSIGYLMRVICFYWMYSINFNDMLIQYGKG